MAWTTPATATVGQVLTAAFLNTNLRDNLNFLFEPAHFLSTGSAPSAAAGAGAGTSPPAPVVVAGSNDTRGRITFGTGTALPAGGGVVVVTFAVAYAAAPIVVITSLHTTAQWPPLLGIDATVAAGFTATTPASPLLAASQANTAYGFTYQVIG